MTKGHSHDGMHNDDFIVSDPDLDGSDHPAIIVINCQSWSFSMCYVAG